MRCRPAPALLDPRNAIYARGPSQVEPRPTTGGDGAAARDLSVDSRYTRECPMKQSAYRIANLLGLRDEGHGYDVPPSVVGSGFTSEVVYTRIATTFVNDLDRSFMDMNY